MNIWDRVRGKKSEREERERSQLGRKKKKEFQKDDVRKKEYDAGKGQPTTYTREKGQAEKGEKKYDLIYDRICLFQYPK